MSCIGYNSFHGLLVAEFPLSRVCLPESKGENLVFYKKTNKIAKGRRNGLSQENVKEV